MPQRPANYDATEALTDPNSASAQHLREMDAYRTSYDMYQIENSARQDVLIEKLTGYVTNEQQKQVQAKRREEVKSQSLSRFQTRGLSTKDAAELYNKIEQAYTADAETGADIFVDLFKGNSNGSESKTLIPAGGGGRRKLPENILLPPGVGTTTGHPEVSKSKAFMKSIEGANQTRKIILNREKK